MNINNFVITVATVNGSGSQSANNILLKSLFRMGIPVGGKNVFPSNIAGLPTWFWIRADEKGFVARREHADIFVAMNPQTLKEDIKTVRKGGFFIYNSDLGIKPELNAETETIHILPISFKPLVDKSTDSIKIKKLVVNMVYVGVLAQLLGIDVLTLNETIADQFEGKESVIEVNRKASEIGFLFAQENINIPFNFKTQKSDRNANKIMMDGNTAGALGWLFGGCTFAAWYPITPSSSVVENYIKFASKYRTDDTGKNKSAIIQAEDELSAICMVLGAGWSGARAVTATSGPGLSLMAESAGFAYFTEIPAVIWDVQRVGPSTGMPTRTAQGDLMSAVFLSHGDTRHPCLIPGSIKECFEFGQTAFDVAERLQQLVIVLSDLDLGMNLWMEERWDYPEKPFDRGKVLSATDLEKVAQFERYADLDGDGIPYRTLPGTPHDKAAYFTRGSGHNRKAAYTEKSDEYQYIVDRLAKKWQTAKTYVPAPVFCDTQNLSARLLNSSSQDVKAVCKNKLGIIAYGSSDMSIKEAMYIMGQQNLNFDYCRIRAVPFQDTILDFIKNHDHVFVVDQNRDGQMFELLKMELPTSVPYLTSVKHYDGTPITADKIVNTIKKNLEVTV
ncbi:MAG: 2-oxoacid:acceptor oxidoreductase subunit alpha [Bdellovibrionaceae bacterium]|nr:2-oxoacid:acceptor oxidoreductase subunit alpha [Pseudobdellovibrionaceae bacterium]